MYWINFSFIDGDMTRPIVRHRSIICRRDSRKRTEVAIQMRLVAKARIENHCRPFHTISPRRAARLEMNTDYRFLLRGVQLEIPGLGSADDRAAESLALRVRVVAEDLNRVVAQTHDDFHSPRRQGPLALVDRRVSVEVP